MVGPYRRVCFWNRLVKDFSLRYPKPDSAVKCVVSLLKEKRTAFRLFLGLAASENMADLYGTIDVTSFEVLAGTQKTV